MGSRDISKGFRAFKEVTGDSRRISKSHWWFHGVLGGFSVFNVDFREFRSGFNGFQGR